MQLSEKKRKKTIWDNLIQSLTTVLTVVI